MPSTGNCTISLLGAVALLPAALVGCGGGEEGNGGAGTRGQETDAKHAETMQGGATQADAQAGKKVWTKAGCGNCHTLVAAGSKGTTGPNLDEHMKEEREQGDDILAHVVKRVRNGGGGMPAFEGRLTEREIRDVAAFVHQATMR